MLFHSLIICKSVILSFHLYHIHTFHFIYIYYIIFAYCEIYVYIYTCTSSASHIHFLRHLICKFLFFFLSFCWGKESVQLGGERRGEKWAGGLVLFGHGLKSVNMVIWPFWKEHLNIYSFDFKRISCRRYVWRCLLIKKTYLTSVLGKCIFR